MDNGKKIGFIGFGNMAQAIAKGLLEAKVCKAEQLYACAAHFEKLKDTADRLGVHPMQTAQEVVQNSDVVILAVKPYLIEQVVAPLKELLKGKMVVSVAAGFTFARYQQLLDESTHHISTIPNTPIAVGEGIMICEQTHSLDEQQWQTFCELFSPIARAGGQRSPFCGRYAGRLYTGIYSDVSGGAVGCRRQVRADPRSLLPHCSKDAVRHRQALSGERDPPGCDEGCRLLSGRNHHPRRICAGKSGISRCSDWSHRRHRREIVRSIRT